MDGICERMYKLWANVLFYFVHKDVENQDQYVFYVMAYRAIPYRIVEYFPYCLMIRWVTLPIEDDWNPGCVRS
jgi:hypothetical protein